jgi:hypothetical protein
MNLASMISQIQARLGFRDDLQSEILREIQLAQYQLERDVTFNPYFLWRAQDIVLHEECLDYALPQGFIRICELNNPLLHPACSPMALELNRGLAFTAYSKDNPARPPDCYTIQHGNLRLNGRVHGVLRLFYITSTQKLDEDCDSNLWTEKAYALLMNRAGLSCAKLVRDAYAEQSFEKEYATSLDTFKRECVAFEDFGYSIARADRLYGSLPPTIGGWYNGGTE